MPRLECPSVSTETRRIIEVAIDTTNGLDYSALLGMVARRVQHTPPDHNSRYQEPRKTLKQPTPKAFKNFWRNRRPANWRIAKWLLGLSGTLDLRGKRRLGPLMPQNLGTRP